jgi:hypothetical protein
MHGGSCNSCGWANVVHGGWLRHAVRAVPLVASRSSKRRRLGARGGGTRGSMGAVIYVERVTKVGMGRARPCWRCVEWCWRVGVKRIFRWNGDGKFDVVKVNTAERDQYETNADGRLFAGMVRPSMFALFAGRWSLTFVAFIRSGKLERSQS